MNELETKNYTADVKPLLDKIFRFAPGDLVVKRAQVERMRAEIEVNGRMKKSRYGDGRRVGIGPYFTVLERRVQECHGGVQLFYVISGHQDKETGGPHNVVCMAYELAPAAEATELAKAVVPLDEDETD
jgi:hypothetical protein